MADQVKFGVVKGSTAVHLMERLVILGVIPARLRKRSVRSVSIAHKGLRLSFRLMPT